MKQTIYSILSSSQELKNLVKDITYSYPNTFEQLPIVCYQLTNIKRYMTFGNNGYKEYYFNIDVFANTSMETDTITDSIIPLIEDVAVEIEIVDIAEENIYHKQLKLKLIV